MRSSVNILRSPQDWKSIALHITKFAESKLNIRGAVKAVIGIMSNLQAYLGAFNDVLSVEALIVGAASWAPHQLGGHTVVFPRNVQFLQYTSLHAFSICGELVT